FISFLVAAVADVPVEIEMREGRAVFGETVLRIVPDPFPGPGNVHAIETIVGQAVKYGKREGGVVDAALDQLSQIGAADECVHDVDAVGILGGGSRKKRADSKGDHRQSLSGGHVASESFAETF